MALKRAETGWFYGDGANIRKKASSTSTKLGYLESGVKVYVSQVSGSYCKISQGWVSYKYLCYTYAETTKGQEEKKKKEEEKKKQQQSSGGSSGGSSSGGSVKYESSPIYSTGYYYAADGCWVRSDSKIIGKDMNAKPNNIVRRLTYRSKIYINQTRYVNGVHWGHFTDGWVSFKNLTQKELPAENQGGGSDPSKNPSEYPSFDEIINSKNYKWTTEAVNIRKDAGTNYASVGRIENTNERVEVLGSKKASNGTTWYKVNHNGIKGYISSSVLSSKELTYRRMYVQKSVWIRTGPGNEYPPVNNVAKFDEPGTLVFVYDTKNTWCEIRYAGNKAWVQSSYLGTVPPDNKSSNNNPIIPSYTTMYVKQGTRARAMPNMAGALLDYYYKNQEVKVIKHMTDGSGWAQIWDNGKTMYMYWDRLSYTPVGDDPVYIKYTKSSCNVRKGPGDSYETCGYFSNLGARVEVVSESGGWAKIKWPGVTTATAEPEKDRAYVSASLLTAVDPHFNINNTKVPILEKGVMYLISEERVYPSMSDCGTSKYSTKLNAGTKVTANYVSNVQYGSQYWCNITAKVGSTTYTGFVPYTSLTKYPAGDVSNRTHLVISVLSNIDNSIQNEWKGLKGEVVISSPLSAIGSCTVDLYAVQKTANGSLQYTLIKSNVMLTYGDSKSIVINFVDLGKKIIKDSEIRYTAMVQDTLTKKVYYTSGSKNDWDQMAGSHYYLTPSEVPTEVWRKNARNSGNMYSVEVLWDVKKDIGDKTSWYDKSYLKLFCKSGNLRHDAKTVQTTNMGTFNYLQDFTTSLDSYNSTYTFEIRKEACDDPEDIEIWAALNYKYELNEWKLTKVPFMKVETPPSPPTCSIYAENNLKQPAKDGLLHGERGTIQISYSHPENKQGKLTVYAYQSKELDATSCVYVETIIEDRLITPSTFKEEVDFTKHKFTRGNYIGYFGIVKSEDGKVTSFPTSSHKDGSIWRLCGTYHYYNDVPSPVTPYFTNNGLINDDNEVHIAWPQSIDPDKHKVTYKLYIRNVDDESKNRFEAENFYVNTKDKVYKRKYDKMYVINEATIPTKDAPYILNVDEYTLGGAEVWLVAMDDYNNSYYLSGNSLTLNSKVGIPAISVQDHIVKDFTGKERKSGDSGIVRAQYVHSSGVDGTVYVHAILKHYGEDGVKKVFKNIASESFKNGETKDIVIDYVKAFGEENRIARIKYFATAVSTKGEGCVAADWEPKESMYDKWTGTHYYNQQPFGSVLSLDEDYDPFAPEDEQGGGGEEGDEGSTPEIPKVFKKLVEGANARTGPGVHYPFSIRINKDEEVQVLTVEEVWAKVVYNEKYYYIPSTALSKETSQTTPSTPSDTTETSTKSLKMEIMADEDGETPEPPTDNTEETETPTDPDDSGNSGETTNPDDSGETTDTPSEEDTSVQDKPYDKTSIYSVRVMWTAAEDVDFEGPDKPDPPVPDENPDSWYGESSKPSVYGFKKYDTAKNFLTADLFSPNIPLGKEKTVITTYN